MYGTVLIALVIVIIGMLAASYMTYCFMKKTYDKMTEHTRDVVDRIMSASDCEDVELGFDDDDDDDEEGDDDDGGRFCPTICPTNRISEYFN